MFLRTALCLAALTQIAQSSPTLSAAPPPPASYALTLDDAIRTAWARDTQTAALALAPQLAQARELQAGLRPAPLLEINTALGLDDKSEWGLGVGVSQTLPRRERVALARAYARIGGEAAPLQLALRRVQLADVVRRLWYALAVHEARAALATRTLSVNRGLVDALAPRHAAGEIAESDWLFLQLEVHRAERALALAEAEREAARAELRARLRWTQTEPLPPLQNDLARLLAADLPALPEQTVPASLPSLRLATHEVAQAQAALDLARSESRGEWTLGAGLEVERRANDASGRLSSEPRLTLSTTAPWPVHAGRAPNRGTIAEREAALRIAQAELDALRDEVAAEAAAALATARALQPVVLAYRDFARAAPDTGQALQPLLTRGEIGPRELVQTQQQHAAIAADSLAVAARYLDARAALEAATAQIPTPSASSTSTSFNPAQ